MKKLLVLFSILTFAGSAFAAEPVETATTPTVLDQVNNVSTTVDAKIQAQTQKTLEQQKKFNAKLRARDKKIEEQQKALKDSYNARQKRLEQKREQLNKLLEE